MLPFTKRPGRAEESGEIVTKESLASDDTGKRDARDKSDRPRPFAKSISDEELTTLMPSKNVAAVARPASVPPPPLSSRPAAPLPNTTLRSARSVPPPRGKFMREEDEGRASLRGAPKIVKKRGGASMGLPTTPTTVSPAAVIKATLETARGNKRNDLMAPPPKELLEELADLHPADANPNTVQLGMPRSQPPAALSPTTANMGANAFQPVGVPAAPSSRSVPPAPMSRSAPPPGVVPHAPVSQSHPPPSMGAHPYAPYGVPVPPASVSVPGVAMAVNAPPSMPAHFMVPQAPYSDARMDPPGTVVPASARGGRGGRSAASWAMALLVLGLGVGIGGISLMRGNADGVLDTTASFIDPARAQAPRAAAAAAPETATDPAKAVEATPATAAPQVAAPATPEPAPTAVTVAPAVVPAVAQPAVAPPAAAPVAQPVAAAPAAQPVAHPVAQPAPQPVAAAPAPAPKPVAAPAPAPKPVAAAPAPKPVAAAPKREAAPASDEAPSKPTKAGKASGKASSGGSDIDEETKKALEALQKSQLESSF